MTKRLIELDDELLEAAQRELNTTGIADTVRSALRLAATRSARVRQIEWLTGGGMAELADGEARAHMALIAKYLLDTSAAARMVDRRVAEVVVPVLEAGLVATTAALDAEALYSARNPAEYEELWRDRRAAYEYVPTNDEHWAMALGAQRALASAGLHRAIGVPDLLTAVLAQDNHLTLLHYDSDFDLAATVLEFRHRWVAVRGSL